MRKLNTRERRWLVVLAIGVLAPPPPTTDKKVTTSSAPSEPEPPRPAFDYIGLLGPKDDLIAVFSREAGIFVAQVGDVIDGTFGRSSS